ncbi:distal tail protein Dit [Helcococcus bovis]|uniref:distal tail protein Dit n=1 Tax=Helcococcus bovis TaxID=3153252 RepID=UPI0038BBFE98
MKIKFNNIVLDDRLEKYTTVNVEGRGLFAPTIKIIDIEGSDGDFIESQKYSSREIKVYFIIKAKNNSEKLEAIEELNLLIQSEDEVAFSFDDEKGYRLGRLKSVENIRYDYFTGQGNFTIYCKKPWKYLENKKLGGNDITINYSEKHSRLEYVDFTFTNTSDEFEIKNITNGDVIKVNNLDGLRGKVIINNNSITINGKVISNKLDYTISTWKNFRIKNGDNIVITGGNTPEVIYRGVIL